jgi:secreted trypsin-like serine protease
MESQLHLRYCKFYLLLFVLLIPIHYSAAQVTKRILGGGYGNFQEPVAFLQSVNGTCTGAVIGKKAILTANHCLDAFRGSVVTAGVKGVRYPIKKGYGGPDDLGLLITNSRISSTRYKIVRNSLPRIGQVLSVYGFGLPEVGTLKYTFLYVAGYESPGSFIAASNNGSTTCSGDSGGPAVVSDSNGHGIILGVVSRGQSSCGIGSATLFGATGSIRGYNWIINKLATVDK